MTEFEENVSLKPYNTFGLQACARKFRIFKTVVDLQNTLSQIGTSPLLVLGGGSNILLTKDFDGIVLKNELQGIEVLEETADHIFVKVAAGEEWHGFVLECINNNWAGVENLSLIPGTVGAAPMQNIGAYGVEIRQVFESLEAVEIATGTIRSFSNEECEFGYRESVFKKALKGKFIITSVLFKLNKVPKYNVSYGAIQNTLEEMGVTQLSLKSVSDAVIHIRQSKLPDPKEIGNAGSFFKNPEVDKIDYEGLKAMFPAIPSYELPNDIFKIPAAWLIEQAGWKGKTFGEIGVHKKQPLVLVNYGAGNGNDLKNLAFEIQESVSDKFGILLTPEVNII
ncbi:UDP-N-acetylmuramate dehydrogenase [Roseivirga misakiensis]|uniref:UDP-N-acetylenolpyruvoylglucosamine reductase n=1 Tax=Roseivirga misakiensis TaxID=1563681 RepID=A0A1E5T0K9_9BACT|nr:UDP-N-acetylmuramate dehydrogenase [Roseivirga misakiensis]OEK04913.1 UDP-N-acetylenolpyruvoylglucosamine reductase [Roseivirga misakiensis]